MHKVYDSNAERIMETLSIENDEVMMYLVPDGHNFFLEEASLSVEVNGPDSGYAYLYWLRGGDWYYMRDICQIWVYTEDVNGRLMVGAVNSDHSIFPSFLKIPAGDLLVLVSQEVGLIAEGNFSGFLASDYL